MTVFSTKNVIVACAASGEAIGRASYRVYPAKFDVSDNTGDAAGNERAGRVLQRLNEGLLEIPPARVEPLRRWLSANAVEVVYEFTCPEHGKEWALSPDIAGPIRHNHGESTWVKVTTH